MVDSNRAADEPGDGFPSLQAKTGFAVVRDRALTVDD